MGRSVSFRYQGGSFGGYFMSSYRLYRLSHLTRRFEPAEEFDAKDDRAAIAVAEAVRAQRAAELWNGSRLIKEWTG
jgi:hypothetical protein